MNFLLKLILAVGIVGPLAAAPFEGERAVPIGTDSALIESMPAHDLNHSYTIKNPYAESAEQPFTFTTKTAPVPVETAATRVSCGGRVWTDGETLGHTGDGKSMVVRIQDNRVYANWGGTITDNIFVLFYLVENTFPNTPENGRLIDACVNPMDPSTAPSQLLGKNSAGKITCNAYVMEDGDLLGTYVADWGETRQHVRVRDGLLRVGVQQGPTDQSTENLQMTLINFTIDGANGSYLAPKWRGVLTKDMINGCFWPRVPKPATPLSDNNCSSGPTVKTVTNVTQTSLRFTFEGIGVNTIKWKILSGLNTVANNTTGSLASTTVNLSYGSLSPGNYKLVIEGGNCVSGQSELSFTIPAAPVQNCASGPTLRTVTNVTATSLRFTYAGTGVSTIKWKILSGVNTVANNTTGNLSSTTVDLSFGSLAAGSYKLVVEGGNCSSAQSELSFTVPVGQVENCPAGPTLQTVSNVTATGLRFTFDGIGVGTIKWKILSGSSTVANNTTASLTSSIVNITFGTLAPGNYKLAIEGGSCKSSLSEMSFTVPGVTDPNCAAGPTLKTVTNITATSLRFTYAGTGVSTIKWKILSGVATVASNTTGTLSSTTVNLTFGSLVPGNYKLAIEGGNCTSGQSELSFTVPTPPIANCTAGPTLKTVTNVTETSLRFTYTGTGVSTIKWKILSGVTTVANNTTGNLSSTTVDLTFSSLSPGTYKLAIEGGNCTSAQSELSFTVPVPPIPSCISGPTVKTITNITATSLRFTFDGLGVSTIKWKILSGATTVANNTTANLTSSTVNLTFASLSPGTYKLAIEGGSCTSAQSEMSFTVPVPPTANCTSGPTLRTVTNITATSLRFTYAGTGVTTIKWKILSGVTTVANNTTGNLSSTTVDLTFASLSPGSYKLAIEGGNCTSVQSELSFTVPVPPIPNCASGPTLKTVTNITATSLRFTFDGIGVSTIKWKILSGSSTVANKTTGTLSSSTVNITFGTLAPGNYKLAIEGGNCTSSQSELSFTVPAPPVPDCVGGPSISTIKNITQSSLTVDFAGTNLQIFSWKVLKSSSEYGSGKTAYLSTKTTSLSFPSLAAGTYTLQITPEDCKGTAASKTFVVPSTPLSPCTKGPNLISLIETSATSMTFEFDGLNVSSINWKIMKGSALMRSSSVAPKSNKPQIDYAKLADGDYTLQIQGGNCTSTVSSKAFNIGGTLPIYVANFNGAVVDDGVELSWQVVAEQDGKEFEVLRYDDKLKNEEVLGTVALTDQRVGKYNFVDEKPLLGINYYQLKQIDVDGTFEKSKMISINPGIITARIAAPNPAQDYVDIQFNSRTSGLSKVSIYSVSGVEVSTSQIQINEGNNTHRLDVKKLIGGSYIIKIAHGGELSKLRFMKVN